MKRILVLEDHPSVQEWVCSLLNAIFPNAMIHTAHSLESCEPHLGLHPQLIMVDLNLPDGKGQELIARVKASMPETRCVVLTSFDDDESLFSSLRVGADGYLLKDQPESELKSCLQGIIDGKPPLSPAVAQRMMQFFQPAEQATHSDFERLAPREQETLKLISRGYTVKETAKAMELSPHTVNGYIKEAYRKLKIHSRAEAARFVMEQGL